MPEKLTPIERERLLKLAQASNLKRKVASVPTIVCVKRGGGLPLSFSQQRLWFLCQMDGASQAYNMPMALHLQGDLNVEGLRWAIERIVIRHEALHTTFTLVDGEPVQQIAGAQGLHFHLPECDLRFCDEAEKDSQLSSLMEETNASFDLQQGPLIRGQLVRLADRQHALLLTIHHIVSDGWSMSLLMNELRALYGAFANGGDDPLPVLGIQYADYAVWQRQWMESGILQEQAAYWQSSLAGAPKLLELPTDHPRPTKQKFEGAFAEFTLDGRLANGMKSLGRKHHATVYMVLLAGWAALMSRLSNQSDLVIGTPVANRRAIEVENLIGFFVDTLAIRLDLSRSPSFSELIEQSRIQTLAAQQHQDIPFERVVELLQPARSPSHSPLCQVMFVWQNAVSAVELPGLQLRILPSPHPLAKFDMTLLLREEGDTIVGGIEYATSLFEASTIERYIGYFRTLLRSFVADPAQTVDRVAMLGEPDLQQVLEAWGHIGCVGTSMNVTELFESQVERTPDAAAVVSEEAVLSYRELNRRANRLAHYLRGFGVGPESRVAICVERGVEAVTGILAVLKAGGAYVPLDPKYPVDRLRYMFEDSAPAVVLTQSQLQGLVRSISNAVPIVDLMAREPAWQKQPDTNPGEGMGPEPAHLAYVIYTSGSSGLPKGVEVSHEGIWDLVRSQVQAFGLGSEDRVLQFASMNFDASVPEIFSAWLTGASLHLASQDQLLPGQPLGGLLQQREITVLTLPPSLLGYMKKEDAASVRVLIVAGEACSPELVEAWAPGRRMFNAYGPTEITVCATLGECSAGRAVDIGRPIEGARVYLLDRHMHPVPQGVTGELYVGGAGVARGYGNRPDLTAERFVCDPFARTLGSRMYATGDLGRWLPEGRIEFQGRNDWQVKIRGHRVELGGIEARLAEHRAVREAVVVARKESSGELRLLAYYTICGEPDAASPELLRSYLAARLPDYMVPVAYVRMEAMPVLPNGKLDRKVLPEPEADARAARRYEPPQGEIESAIADIWTETLKLDRVSRLDNFFELGGHSLLAVRVVTRLRRKLGVEAGMLDLFWHPVLADLAGKISTYAPPSSIPRAIRRERPAHNASRIITATRHDGHKIASEDNGRTWYDHQTGKAIQ